MNFGIIAAGEGSRLVQEGVALPKPLVELGDEPMIGRLIRVFAEAGATEVNVIVNSAMTEVADYLRSGKTAVPVNLVVKSTPSSMHSMWELSRLLRGRGRFIVTTVDTIFHADDFKAYASAFEQAGPEVDGMMAVTSYIDDEKPLYVETDAEDRIVAFRDTPWEGVRYVSGGIYGLGEGAFRVLDRCIETGVSRMRNFQRALIEAGERLRAFDAGKIIDVDHAGDIAKAEAFLGLH